MRIGGVLEACVRMVGRGMMGSMAGALGRAAVTVAMICLSWQEDERGVK